MSHRQQQHRFFGQDDLVFTLLTWLSREDVDSMSRVCHSARDVVAINRRRYRLLATVLARDSKDVGEIVQSIQAAERNIDLRIELEDDAPRMLCCLDGQNDKLEALTLNFGSDAAYLVWTALETRPFPKLRRLTISADYADTDGLFPVGSTDIVEMSVDTLHAVASYSRLERLTVKNVQILGIADRIPARKWTSPVKLIEYVSAFATLNGRVAADIFPTLFPAVSALRVQMPTDSPPEASHYKPKYKDIDVRFDCRGGRHLLDALLSTQVERVTLGNPSVLSPETICHLLQGHTFTHMVHTDQFCLSSPDGFTRILKDDLGPEFLDIDMFQLAPQLALNLTSLSVHEDILIFTYSGAHDIFSDVSQLKIFVCAGPRTRRLETENECSIHFPKLASLELQSDGSEISMTFITIETIVVRTISYETRPLQRLVLRYVTVEDDSSQLGRLARLWDMQVKA